MKATNLINRNELGIGIKSCEVDVAPRNLAGRKM